MALVTITCLSLGVHAESALDYPRGELTAGQVAQQVHLVLRSGLLKNALSEKQGNERALIVNRGPLEKRKSGDRPSVISFDTYINNTSSNPAIESIRMAVMASGKSKGTGILLTRYRDPGRSSNMLMWLPSLRKIRRILEPDPQDYWFGTTLTYGELILRRVEDDHHELIDQGVLEGCLEAMKLEPSEVSRRTRELPEPQCKHQGRPIYRLKSSAKRDDWWYDHYISEVDRESFALYRTHYFKGYEKVKTVNVDWQSLDETDPRLIYPRYIYSMLHTNGRDSLVYIPFSTIQQNVDLPDSFWSERTLKKKGR